MTEEDDSAWLFDSMMGFFGSPQWALPVMAFIDDNCAVFDDEDENKLSYMTIYAAFKEMVDSLLEMHLQDMGISIDRFLEICATAGNATPAGRMALEQILAVDDFLSFKKMMVKRNMELELEAMRALQSLSRKFEEGGDTGADGGEVDPAEIGEDDFEAQLAYALELSMKEAMQSGELPQLSDEEIMAQQRHMEDAELEFQREMEAAIAMSMEQHSEEQRQMAERLEQFEQQFKAEAPPPPPPPPPAAPPPPEPEPYQPPEPEPYQPPEPEPYQPPEPEPERPPAELPPVSSAPPPLRPLGGTLPQSTINMSPLGSALPLGRPAPTLGARSSLAPIGGGGGGVPAAPRPEELRAAKAAATAAEAREREQRHAAERAEANAAANMSAKQQAELKARAEYLRKQRDLILAQRKKAREEEAAHYQPPPRPAAPAAPEAAAADAGAMGRAAGYSDGGAKEAKEEMDGEHRALLSRALASSMKASLLSSTF